MPLQMAKSPMGKLMLARRKLTAQNCWTSTTLLFRRFKSVTFQACILPQVHIREKSLILCLFWPRVFHLPRAAALEKSAHGLGLAAPREPSVGVWLSVVHTGLVLW
jgi:hypothetical protein